MKMIRFTFLVLLFVPILIQAQETPPTWGGKFEQLGPVLPTPNEYRSGSGAPGPEYWQQQADYKIDVTLDDNSQRISGSETITYHNNSPDVLKYLWLQLDQNILSKENTLGSTDTGRVRDSVSAKSYADKVSSFEGGFNIQEVTDEAGNKLPHIINNTMMRVDLPSALKPGGKYSFRISWSFNINDRNIFRERSGLEYFPEDKNYVYTIAQFFPRMCVYDDYEGWQNKQFLGNGEFALPFGNYEVKITVPADHIVAATGTLQNPQDVLTKTEMDRLRKAETTFDKPVLIVTEAEAVKKEKTKSTAQKTWVFHGENVRDFAFASSRKFIWDAQAVKIGDKTPLAMSFYPKEGNPLWEKESTKAVKNTLEVYSRLTIEYPYPVAISVHAASIGMEYPMICFNYGRPTKDGRISPQLRQGMIGVIVHEVGHNFFPMIINNDERQSTWMDEGLNSFVQLLTELERYPDINWTRGKPSEIVGYMKGDKSLMRPLMTNSEQVIYFGAEQYAKAAAGLYMLRQTIMGPELFDRAFKEYAERWAFKHPKPADFFRTIEDASAVDLDWFWRGWFYTTDQVDISLDEVKWFRMNPPTVDPEKKNVTVKQPKTSDGPATNFESGPASFTLMETNPQYNGEFRNSVDDQEIMQRIAGKNIYEVKLSNRGGLVMPVILEWTFKDGTKEVERVPAEIWRSNESRISKVFIKEKEVVKVVLDPMLETSDVNTLNNVFPKLPEGTSRFDEFKKKSN